MNDQIFISYSALAAISLKDGDRVRCVSSTVLGREGQEWPIYYIGKSKNLKNVAMLKFYESYGDKFEKV